MKIVLITYMYKYRGYPNRFKKIKIDQESRQVHILSQTKNLTT